MKSMDDQKQNEPQDSKEPVQPAQPQEHKSKIHKILHDFADALGNAIGEAMENR